MTIARYNRGELSLSISGHAGAAKKGEDTVCAALSILAMTLERRLSDGDYVTVKSRADGDMSIRCIPERRQERQCREIFDTVFTGLRLLGQNCPEYVRAEEIG